jgi:hypothetical protein
MSRHVLAEFGADELMQIGERAEAGEFVGLERELEGFFDEDYELRERERIEGEVFDEADFIGGGLEFGSEWALDEAFDHTVKDRGQMGGVAREAILTRGGVGRG